VLRYCYRDSKELTDELREQYAELIRTETERIKAITEREYGHLRCEEHGEPLTIELGFGPNIYTGVCGGYRYIGCCDQFVWDVATLYDRYDEYPRTEGA
jgi:hypothetical protein